MTNPTTIVGATAETPVEDVVPTTENRQVVTVDMNRLAASYPWGMPPNFVAHFSNGVPSSLIQLSLPLLLLETLLSRGVYLLLRLLQLMLPTPRTTKLRSLMKLLTLKVSTEARASTFRFLLKLLNL